MCCEKKSKAGAAQTARRPLDRTVSREHRSGVYSGQQCRSGWYQKPKPRVLDAPLKARMHEIASTRVRYGFWRIFVLIRREGWQVNHKRVYRLYKEEGLNLRTKRPRRRKAAAHRLERPVLTTANQSWSTDFVSDALFDGRCFRILTLVDKRVSRILWTRHNMRENDHGYARETQEAIYCDPGGRPYGPISEAA